MNLDRYVGNGPTNGVDSAGLAQTVVELYYDPSRYQELGLQINKAVQDEVNRILNDAVSRCAAPGSKLRIIWTPLKPAQYAGQKTGWVESMDYTWGEIGAQAYVSGWPIPPLLGAIWVAGWQTPVPQRNTTVRIKIDIKPMGGVGGTDNFGYGSGFQIDLYRDGIKGEFDARPDRKQDEIVGDIIAHEIVHALGKIGHDGTNCIDSSPLTPGTTYSKEGAEYVIKKLKLPPR